MENAANVQNATTDAKGFYSISRIAPGEVNVSASVSLDDATRSENKTAAVVAGATTTVNFNVEFGTGTIEGVVRDGGEPVADGYISAMLLETDALMPQSIEGRVSPGGAYRISGLDAGAYKLMVNVGLFGEDSGKTRTVEVSVGDGETVHLDIDLDAGAHVYGVITGVTDTTTCMVFAFGGTPQIADLATAMTTPEIQTRIAGTASVDASGAYDISGLDAGDYTVLVIHVGAETPEDVPFASGHVTVGDSGGVELNLAVP